MSTSGEHIVVYSSPLCGYCGAALRLLRRKGVEPTEIDVLAHPDRRREVIALTGRRTVPQIFIRGVHVGGYDELRSLEEAGRLDALLAAEPYYSRHEEVNTRHG